MLKKTTHVGGAHAQIFCQRRHSLADLHGLFAPLILNPGHLMRRNVVTQVTAPGQNILLNKPARRFVHRSRAADFVVNAEVAGDARQIRPLPQDGAGQPMQREHPIAAIRKAGFSQQTAHARANIVDRRIRERDDEQFRFTGNRSAAQKFSHECSKRMRLSAAGDGRHSEPPPTPTGNLLLLESKCQIRSCRPARQPALRKESPEQCRPPSPRCSRYSAHLCPQRHTHPG